VTIRPAAGFDGYRSVRRLDVTTATNGPSFDALSGGNGGIR
jgi:hypothetical protein